MRTAIQERERARMVESINRWMLRGEVGVSSEAIAGRMIGIRPKWNYSNYPCDPDDFRRCLLLIAMIPEIRNRLDEMKSESPEWSRLIDRWGDIESSFMSEVGLQCEHGTSAPKTYALMRECIEE